VRAVKVLVVHADYLEPGGETISATAEVEILREAGHDVETYFRSNRDFSQQSRARQITNLVYNRAVAKEIGAVLRRFPADVVHCNNLFPGLSPSAYHAASQHGAAVVQSLRNYRLACPAATFFRDGKVCFDCSGRRLALPSIQHACYRGSRSTTAGVAVSSFLHDLSGMHDRVDAYIVLSERAKQLLAAAKVNPAKMHVKYNVVTPPPAVGDGSGGYFLFAGRLKPEKGVLDVLAAAGRIGLPIKIVGDGELRPRVQAAADAGAVEWHPHLDHAALLGLMGQARAVLAVPTWEEPFGRTVAESLAVGTPVIVTPLGALPELVEDGVHGRVVPPADGVALAEAIAGFAAMDDPSYLQMRRAAHARYEALFSARGNAARLTEIYRIALAGRRRAKAAGADRNLASTPHASDSA
jgi:glycosyltransferase involved in cell wall biosynthesis